MLDINFIKENIDLVKKGAKLKGYDADKYVDSVISLDERRKPLIKEVEILRAQRNELSQNIKGKPDAQVVEKVKKIKESLNKKEEDLNKIENELRTNLLSIPNYPNEDALVGRSDKENKPIKNIGEPKKFDFKVKDHAELGKSLDIIDVERGVKIGGTRSYILKKEMVILEQSLLRYAIDLVTESGFDVMNVPVLVKENVLIGAGFFPFGREDVYEVNEKDQFLVGTSEASLVYYHSDEILEENKLPRLMSGITSCFRKEAGTYGKDTQGVIRVHQFNKVEQVVLCKQEEWQKMFDLILGVSEKIVSTLGLPYRLVEICTGDLGAKNAKQVDIEVWFPAQEKYRETHSCSYLRDYQGRRSNIKYKDADGNKKFVHTLNNTAVATPRILAAVLENYQQKDGSIKVPDVLVKYTGFSEIKK
jgi:seryl-tRNA synthetase